MLQLLWKGTAKLFAMQNFRKQNVLSNKAVLFCLMALLSLAVCPLVSSVPEPDSNTPAPEDDDDCGLDGYEAHCVLDIMEEHIEATAIVNHCHIPLDITFRVIYRYGDGNEQRWQYTFVTTNQNERVLIPGLILPPAPYALVYLFVRVPQPLFDLHNESLAAVEASFVAVLSQDQWEEVEFLNEAVIVKTTDDCYIGKQNDPILYILGGAVLGLLLVGGVSTALVWCVRRRKLALDELALVSSMETGIPGAQPYQVSSAVENSSNNNVTAKVAKEQREESRSSSHPVEAVPNGQHESVIFNRNSCDCKSSNESQSQSSCFKFGRLKEDPATTKKPDLLHKMTEKAFVIGNPVLVDKTSLMIPKFNRVVSSENDSSKIDIDSVGDTFQNVHSVNDVDEERNANSDDVAACAEDLGRMKAPVSINNSDSQNDVCDSSKNWEIHPLES